MEKKDLILIYLLMSVDEKVSKEELEKFHELVKQSGVESEERAIIDSAKGILSQVEPEDLCLGDVNELYEKYKNAIPSLCSFAEAISTIYSDPKKDKQLLWVMINMAFADGEFSENEKNFIFNCYCNDKKIESSITDEMVESAKTLYSLYSYRDWLKLNSKKSYSETEAIINELDKNQKVLEENVLELINSN